jgi:AraC-like DNA-binding protein
MRVQAGDLICTFPGLAHTYYRRGHTKWSEYHLIFQGDLVRQMERDGLLDRRRPVWRLGLQTRAVKLLRSLVLDCLERPVCRHAQAMARLHQFLAEAQEELEEARRGGGSPLIRRACDLLGRNLRERLDLYEVARELGLKYDAFRRRFRAEAGMAPNQYRLRRRLEAAQQALLKSPRPIKTIAYDFGFCNPFFFSAQFKRLTGLSPRVFRESAKTPAGEAAPRRLET